MIDRRMIGWVALFGMVAATPALSADLSHRHHRVWHPVAPSVDAIQLSQVAPPARRSTVLGTYGDASIARAHFQRRYDDLAEQGPAPYPCDPRLAGLGGTLCTNPPGRRGYGQGYAFTPAYVSAPQVVGADPGDQAALLPPFTALAWAINGLRFDPH